MRKREKNYYVVGTFGSAGTQQNPTFGNLANQNTLGFGSLAQQSPTPAAPQQSVFGR